MAPLDRKLLRDLWRIRLQALAIALVIGCGVATVVMSFSALHSLQETRLAYYERHRFAQIFAPVKRAPESLMARLREIPGVAFADARIVRDVTLDLPDLAEPATARLVSVPQRGAMILNLPALRSGRLPDPLSADEVVASESFAEAHRLLPGDRLRATINGRRRELRVVGTALSPEYVYALGPGQLMPDDSRFGVLWIGQRALEAAFDLDGAFNMASFTLLPGTAEAAVLQRLDTLLAPYGGTGAYGRKDQLSDAFLTGELDQLRLVGRVIPPIFLAVAGFLLHMVVARLIATEREQIGLLKAFGYTDLAIGWHYLKLVLALAGGGVLLGWGGGAWLGHAMTELYSQFYRFPLLFYRPDSAAFAWSAGIAFAVTGAGALLAVRGAVRLAPATAMAPPAPAIYRGGFLTRTNLARRFSGQTRMALRHLLRWPLRTALTTLGTASAMALLVASLFTFDSIDRILQVQFFFAHRQDASVAFAEIRGERAVEELRHLPGVLAAEGFRTVPVRLKARHLSHRTALLGIEPGATLTRITDDRLRQVAVPPSGILLSSRLAELLDAGPGDLVTVEALDGTRRTDVVPVAAVVEEYIGAQAYMDRRALNRLMSETPTISGAHLQVDLPHSAALFRRLKDVPAVAGLVSRAATVAAFRSTMARSMNIIISFYVAFAVLISFGVLYNTSRIALSEHGRELASLRVLGFTAREVAYVLLVELAVPTLLALPLGALLGHALAAFIAASLATDLYRVPLVVDRSTYGWAAVVILTSAFLSALAVWARVRRLNLIAVLKTRE